MHPPKLQFLLLLSIAGSSSAMALLRRDELHVPHHRRDHGNPFVPVQSPKATSISTTAQASSDPATSTPTSVVTATMSLTTIQPTTTALSTSSLTSQTTGTSTSTTSLISSTSSSFSMAPTPTTSTTSSSSTALSTAPSLALPSTTASSSPSGRTWVIAGIFGLAFGLLGLVICILTSMRRRERRKRARGVKREVELLAMEVGGVVGGKGTVGGGGGRLNRQDSVYGSTVAGRAGESRGGLVGREDETRGHGGKWEEAGEKSGNMEDEEEWEQELPAYHR